MPNLVGIGNSQVPTNSMLGGLAYQDPSHANLTEVEIENIAAIKAKVDAQGSLRALFVYDTSRDSDGGAWRKKTSDTSWYNETLGTLNRGYRREFPAVAILAASSTALAIYDADDPNCPMWMKFQVHNNKWLKHTVGGGVDCTCVYALNGMIVSGGGASQGRLSVVNFPGDGGYVTEAGYTYTHDYISRRNDESVGANDGGSRSLSNHYVKDITMWVNPWAPLNQKSGLPTPTIAVATTGGICIINDGQPGSTLGETGNGGVIDGTSSSGSNYSDVRQVTVTNDGWVWWNADNQGANARDTYALRRELVSRISGDFTWSNSADTFSIPVQDGCDYTQGTNALSISTANEQGNLQVGYANEFSFNFMRGNGFANPYGWGFWTPVIMHSHDNNTGRGMVAQITSYSTTGLMPNVAPNGSSWCGETDERTLGWGGTNILTNGDFSDGTSGWYGDSGASISESGGVATVTNGGGDNTYAIAQANVLRKGRKYRVSGTIVPTFSGSYKFRVRGGGSGVSWSITSGLTSGSSYNFDTGTFVADGAPLEIGSEGGNITQFTIDNIVCAQVGIEDVAGNNWAIPVVTGTLTQSPVSNGAELCGVGPFNGSNYAKVAGVNHNYGNPARVTMMGWFKTTYTSGYQYIMSMGDSNSGHTMVIAIETSNGGLYFFDSENGWNNSNNHEWHDNSKNVRDGKWHHVAGVYDAQDRKILYRDGMPVKTTDPGNDVNFSSVSSYHIGHYSSDGSNLHHPVGNGTSGCQVSLVKVSEVALTNEQIKRIYEAEKPLFYENAQCTIYGTSSTATAFAHDQVLDRYHVGTSAGRSDFDGLRRINNTTTAVTTAIAACDGLIVDQ